MTDRQALFAAARPFAPNGKLTQAQVDLIDKLADAFGLERVAVTTEPLSEAARFDRCLKEILRWEGGYVDHPRDPGGATNMGITIGTLREWRGHKPVTKDDVRNLTREEAAAIYRKNYWQKSGADAAPAGLDLMIFDCAVNQGVGRAVGWTQEALGVPVDRVVGPVTRGALSNITPGLGAVQMVDAIADRRLRHYRGLATFDTFGKGWTRRLDHVRGLAREWAS